MWYHCICSCSRTVSKSLTPSLKRWALVFSELFVSLQPS
ncbi:MAG: DUF6527 family protein [Planktothrix sp.]